VKVDIHAVTVKVDPLGVVIVVYQTSVGELVENHGLLVDNESTKVSVVV
jgi:hypothetical protein